MPVNVFNRPGRVRGTVRVSSLASGRTSPPARFPTGKILYVRKTGSDNNGGDTAATSAPITGSDGMLDGSAIFTSASAAFDASYVDRLINIVGVGRFRIEEVIGANSIRLSANALATSEDWTTFGEPSFLPLGDGTFVSFAVGFCGKPTSLVYVDLKLRKNGSPSDNVVCEIQGATPAGPDGNVLATASIAASSITVVGNPDTAPTYRFTFGSPLALDPALRYFIVVHRSGAPDAANYAQWSERDHGEGRYTLGANYTNTGAGFGLSIPQYGNQYRFGYTGATGLTWNVGGAVQTVGAFLTNGNDAVREGDTIYVGAGTYRETIRIRSASKHGALSVISVIGDTDGTHTGDAGLVTHSAFTSGDAALAANAPLLWFGSGVSGFSFSKFFWVASTLVPYGAWIHAGHGSFIGAPGNLTLSAQATSQMLSFTDSSVFLGPAGSSALAVASVQPGYPLNWTVDRMQFSVGNGGTVFQLVGLGGVSTNDVDLEMVIRNSVMRCGVLFTLGYANTVATRWGGVLIRDNTIFGGVVASGGSASPSVVIPILVYNNLIMWSPSTAIATLTLGQVVEDYNLFYVNTPRSNVSVGAHSVSDGSYAPLLHFGQEVMAGMQLRPLGEPMVGSGLFSFVGDGLETVYDVRNNPRPAGGASASSALGALDRGNTFAKETGTVHTGTTAISAIGPAYHDFLVAVTSGVSYTFSIYVNYDASYTGIIAATAPSTPILDSFTRANEDPLSGGGNWANGWTGLLGALKVVSNAVLSNVSNAMSYWTPTQFGNCEASVTTNLTDDTLNARVYARWTPGANGSGYGVNWQNGTFDLVRFDAGAPTTLATTPLPRAPGDKLAIRCIGTTIEAWAYRGGAWSRIHSVTDATYATGYIGLGTNSTAAGGLDDFSGGRVGPEFSVINGSECGVSDQSVSAEGPVSTWQQISLAPFVPTSDGFVTVRVQSNDASGTSEVVFDTFAAT